MSNNALLKTCQICNTEKTLDCFYKNVSRKRHMSDLVKVQKTCAECHSRLRKLHYDQNKDFYKNKHLMRAYGITVEQYRDLQMKQNNVCACCKKPESRYSHHSKTLSDLAVDHCHKTGKIRGLLCFKCNMAIGLLKDDVGTLTEAVRYLNESS